MDNEKREALALRLIQGGALRPAPGKSPPLVWQGEAALANGELRGLLAAELAETVRDHYPAAQALAGPWAEELAGRLGLPAAGEQWPDRTVLVCGGTGELIPFLDRLEAMRRAGGSPAAAVILNGREEEVRLRMDRADVRCHWLTDLESAGAAALQNGYLDFEDYCRLLPQG